MEEIQGVSFRSIFPQEPLPTPEEESFGYVNIQGAFTPKIVQKNKNKKSKEGIDNGDDGISTQLPPLPDLKSVQEDLLNFFKHNANEQQLPCNDVLSVEIIVNNNNNNKNKDKPSSESDAKQTPTQQAFTKARIVYSSAITARSVVSYLRNHPISPSIIFAHRTTTTNTTTATDLVEYEYNYNTKPIQANQITKQPLLSSDQAWNRAGPPKFRRLILKNSENSYFDDEVIRQQRRETRFLFMTNLFDNDATLSIENHDNGDGDMTAASLVDSIDPNLIQDALRIALQPYCTTTNNKTTKSAPPVEVFVPYPSKKTILNPFKHCHIGTRCAEDATRILQTLQNRSLDLKLNIQLPNNNNNTTTDVTIRTGKLFLDYVGIAQKNPSKSKNNTANNNSSSSSSTQGGEAPRPECTSKTKSTTVPGLILLQNYITPEEESTLLAVLQGPHTPWAPDQTNFSKRGKVKRRVQHYGYVFGYETADVIRDRTSLEGCCPPLPSLPDSIIQNDDDDYDKLELFINEAVKDGRGWDVFAGILERIRRHDFSSSSDSSSNDKADVLRTTALLSDNDNNVKDHSPSSNKNVSKSDEAGITKDGHNCITSPPTTPNKPHQSFPNINQITVNEYKPGEGIGSHVDTITAFSDGLMSLSLNADCVMEFRKQNCDVNDDNQRKLVHLPPRSLLVMTGPARYSWEHMIVSRMTDQVDGKVIPRGTRLSLTLRTALSLAENGIEAKPMERIESNDFPPKWGQQRRNDDSSSTEDLITPDTEKQHVHAVYDAIATQWHHTRGKRGCLWPGATQFLSQLPKGSVVADVGCGDGKYFPAIWEAGSYVIGSDISEPLLRTSVGACIGSDNSRDGPSNRKVSKHREGLNSRPAVLVADCMHVPLRSGSCDAAICIAVMHHLSTLSRRKRCLTELARIVKVGGVINVQAWALEQESGSRRKFAGTDVFVPFNAQPKYLDKLPKDSEEDKVASDENNVQPKAVAEQYADAYDGAEYDERKGLVVFQRYCHMYKEGELEEIVADIDSLSVIESGFESGNHFVILKVVKET